MAMAPPAPEDRIGRAEPRLDDKSQEARAKEGVRARFAELRREVQNLLASLDQIDAAVAGKPDDLARALADGDSVITDRTPAILDRLKTIRATADDDPVVG